MAQNARRDLESRRWRMRPARRRAVPRHLQVRRASRGLNTGCRGLPLSPDSLAAISMPAAEIRRGGPTPSPRLDAGGRDPQLWPASLPADRLLSLRRRPRTASFAAAVARLPRRGLDAGGRDPPRRPASLPALSTPADPPWRPDSLAAVSTPATGVRRCGPTPSLRSRRRRPRSAAVARPRSAAVARLPCRTLDAFAMVSTPAAENRLFFPPRLPRFRRWRPGSAAVARCLNACGRGPPRCPAALATCHNLPIFLAKYL